jgi:conjugative relaxase-like TrwC/TraI family protein
VWTGDQAAALGLSGDVTVEALELLLEGRDPTSGSPLGRLLEDRFRADGRVVRAVSGFDATFSAPKSLSVWWALTGDQRLLDAHDVAVSAALKHVETFGSTTRMRVNGDRQYVDTTGLTIAKFRQTTSRADDPQIHTHAVISSKVSTPDEQWWALDARYLKRKQRMVGGIYQSVLRAELSHRFGIGWEPIVNGQAEIAGTPRELVEVFSKRTGQVEAALHLKVAEFRVRQGRYPTRWEHAALTREAAVDTRARKSGNAAADLRSRWLTEAAVLGVTPDSLIASITAAASWHRKAYIGLSQRFIRRYATAGIACSQAAAQALFGAAWRSDPRWRVVYYGVDFKPFGEVVDSASVRAELNIPRGAFVIGHVGRFEPQKNHEFFLQVAAEIVRREPAAHFLLIGEGSLQPAVRRQAERLGIADRVIMTGVCSDVPRLMRGAMDAFLFPSRYEGLGLVLVESQAAGVPCFFSDCIPPEATVVCVLTGAGVKWPDALVDALTPRELIDASPSGVRAWIDAAAPR